jgi:hypothetical protein
MFSCRLALCAFVSITVPVATSVAQAHPESDPRIAAGLEKLRTATKPFQNLDSAVAAGFPREVPNCLVHEHHGAMGYHHVNRANFTTTLTVERPQILLYERLANGTYKLNGVEFIVPYSIWPRDSVPPVILAQKMKHEDNLKIWYTHVWAWSNNTDGIFADFNPSVTCPAETRKVYTPFVAPPSR